MLALLGVSNPPSGVEEMSTFLKSSFGGLAGGVDDEDESLSNLFVFSSFAAIDCSRLLIEALFLVNSSNPNSATSFVLMSL